MPSGDATRATVRHTELAGKSVPAGLSKLDGVCLAGTQCQEVQASPMGLLALADLQTEVATAHAKLTGLVNAITESRAASKALRRAFGTAVGTLVVYERIVADLAGGDPAIITGAGLLARGVHTPPAALDRVTVVRGKPGKNAAEAILSWPRAKGATGYAIEVSFTTDSPDCPWTALPNGSRRTRVVTAPARGARLLARVAAVDGAGNRSDWSTPILVTTAG
jgi:hypothetical protein